MAANVVSLSATGYTIPVKIDLARFQFGVGLLVTVDSGATATYTVEVSGDPQPVYQRNDLSPTHWNAHDILSALDVSANSNLAFPCTYVRLHVSSYSGTGSVTLAVVQADDPES